MSDIIHYNDRTYDLKNKLSFYSYMCQTKGLSSNDLSYMEKYFITDYESLLNKISDLTTENATLKKRIEKLRVALLFECGDRCVYYINTCSAYKAIDQDDKLAGGSGEP